MPPGYRSAKPARPPRGSSQRCVTPVTRPGVPVPASRASSSRQRATGPSAMTFTLPSWRFSAEPARPSSSARARTPHRKPTPCTRPAIQAVSRAAASPAGSLPRRSISPPSISPLVTPRSAISPAAMSPPPAMSASLVMSPPGPPRPGLALRAAVRRPVHERIAPHRGTAPGARLAGPGVHGERPLEVAALPVHIHVQAVEGGAADVKCLGEDLLDGLEQAGDLGARQCLGRARPVQPRAPECLVRVDVADAADQRLVKQRPLDPGPAGADPGGERGQVEAG